MREKKKAKIKPLISFRPPVRRDAIDADSFVVWWVRIQLHVRYWPNLPERDEEVQVGKSLRSVFRGIHIASDGL